MSAHIYKQISNPADLRGLLQVYKEAFELPEYVLPNQNHLQMLLSNPVTVFLAAYDENRVIGGLTTYVLPSVYSEQHEMYLYDFAILPDYQRKGIGRQLLNFLKERTRALNISEIFVQADVADQGALAFYRATGGIEEDVRHFGYKVD